MPDRFGPRGVMALHIPLQNANMQPEYEMMRPDGINNQIYRINLGKPELVSESTVEVIRGALGCWPDVFVVGNSIEMREWSIEQQNRHRQLIQAEIGDHPLVLGGDATLAALRAFDAKRVSILSPMHQRYSDSARSYYESLGFEVMGDHCMNVQLPEDIIKVPDQAILDMFEEMDRPDIDVLLHVGGALSVVPLIDQLEKKHGKPVISVNQASYWMALRTLGVEDSVKGFGQLLTMPLP